MFRKILITTVFATAAGSCFAAETALPQVVTSEVYYTQDNLQNLETSSVSSSQTSQVVQVPTWPLAGSDADVDISKGSVLPEDNIKIVSKIGADMVVENNINLGTRSDFGGWSGGANMLHGNQVPAGFDDCNAGTEMPLMHREMLEDDGGQVLSVSRGNRSKCGNGSNVYNYTETTKSTIDDKSAEADIAVDESADAEAPKELKDQVRSWVVASGQSLHEVLQVWCDKEGWDLVWATAREYPIEASAVFKGRFVDVSSALVRNFGRATPIPYAKFYNGNRVLVITTIEE